MEMEPFTSDVAILGIGTAVPAYRLDQLEVLERLTDALKEHSDSMRWSKRIFKQCGVETRYTCEPDLLSPAAECRYFPSDSLENVPSTKERMERYKRESVPLALESSKKALEDSHTAVSDITHLITVSCTGQFLPGMDVDLTMRLGLSPNIQRMPLQFLGCAAGLKAVSLARQIVAGMPSANVLIVCVELCTLHIQPSSQREALFGASFFGDGASACVVGRARPEHKKVFRLGKGNTVLLPDSTDEMVWEVGNYGFDLFLSPNIPKLLGRYVPAEIEQIFNGKTLPELWAIHPGGRGIIDTLQDLFALSEEQTRPSRNTLRNYGNVSSATILFVLDEYRRELTPARTDTHPICGIALAFGPGLTAELIEVDYFPNGIPLGAGVGISYV
nr:type III polyketide synthase [Paenibacillus tyrfis]